MPATLRHDHGNIYRLDVQGQLAKPELDRAQDDLLAAMKRTGQSSVRLLVLLDLFEGWVSGAGWNDLSFYISHGDRIEKVAMVGDARRRDEMLMFAAADLRKAPVTFFETGDGAEDRARQWLEAD